MGRKSDRPRLCFCTAFQCSGKAISAAEFTSHEAASEELITAVQQDDALKKVEDDILKMTLCDSWQSPNPMQPLPLHTPNPCTKEIKDAYWSLLGIDSTINQHQNEVTCALAEWNPDGMIAKPIESRFSTMRDAAAFLSRERAWFCDIAARLSQTPSCGDAINSQFIAVMIKRTDSVSNQIEQRLAQWRELDVQAASSGDHYNTGEFPVGICIVHLTLSVVSVDRYFDHPLRKAHPVIVVTMFVAVVLNVIANVSRMPCNFILRLIKHVLHLAAPSTTWNNIPDDIRTARQKFDLDPVTATYATCPVCSFLYSPTEKDGHQVYPARCTFKRYPTSRSCGARLTKLGVENGVTSRVPIRPYVMQSFTDFVGKLYCRPGIEELIRRTREYVKESEDVWDINQASAIREFRGIDNKIFVDCEDEIRTVWSFSYDAFNPFHNKAAGKSASVGSMAMECLSLPSSFRKRPENIYFAGAVPGPKQPSLEGLNPFMAPLVDVLDHSYLYGTWFTRTFEHPEGRRSREAIIPTVNDLPGSRKVTGSASHSANMFCSLCHLQKSEINCLDESKFRPKTCEEHRKFAKEWLEATSKTRRKALFKKHGVRWSELLRLCYWDPVNWVVVDGMHNLFLGLVRHHFRVVIGTKWDERDDETDMIVRDQTPKETDLKRGRRLLAVPGTTLKQLETLPIPALRELCVEYDVTQTVAQTGHRVKKRPFANALLVRRLVTQLPLSC